MIHKCSKSNKLWNRYHFYMLLSIIKKKLKIPFFLTFSLILFQPHNDKCSEHSCKWHLCLIKTHTLGNPIWKLWNIWHFITSFCTYFWEWWNKNNLIEMGWNFFLSSRFYRVRDVSFFPFKKWNLLNGVVFTNIFKLI